MGRLLPDRHPNRDFFILDVADAAPKDDMASMEHPVFSLSVKPDMRELSYDYGDTRLRVVPSGRGLATIMDKDILLYCISKLVHELNSGADITPWVELTAHEVMVATNWRTNRESYQRFEDALVRLKGTVILTDIKTGETMQTRGFGLIEEFQIDRRGKDGELSPFGRMTKVRIKISDWTFRAVKGMEVLTINPQYFRLRRPLERRIYELARKHAGEPRRGKRQSGPFRIGIGKLQHKVGSNAPPKKFRFFLREIIRDGHIPDYNITIEDDLAVFSTRKPPALPGRVPLRPETLDRAQVIAAEKGLSVASLEAEWNDWIEKTGKMPDRPDGAFIGFCKKKPSARQTQLFDDWH
ncbi:MAG: replication initiator protein A [Pseudomonadota bacterium]